MTPQEKAQELIDKMSFETHKYNAKQCAIIAVDEILNELKPFFGLKDVDGLSSLLLEEIFLSEHYYNEVKQEIEKL